MAAAACFGACWFWRLLIRLPNDDPTAVLGGRPRPRDRVLGPGHACGLDKERNRMAQRSRSHRTPRASLHLVSQSVCQSVAPSQPSSLRSWCFWLHMHTKSQQAAIEAPAFERQWADCSYINPIQSIERSSGQSSAWWDGSAGWQRRQGSAVRAVQRPEVSMPVCLCTCVDQNHHPSIRAGVKYVYIHTPRTHDRKLLRSCMPVCVCVWGSSAGLGHGMVVDYTNTLDRPNTYHSSR